MKKLFLFGLMMLGLSVMSFSQFNSRTIGARLGGGSYNGAELSYQHPAGSNRFEFDLGFGTNKDHSRIYLVGLYHWGWTLGEGFSWYVGPGASAGLYTYTNADGFINIAVGGQIGIEYNFIKKDIPLQLSLDARPMWDFLGDHPGLGWGACLGVRYVWK